LETFRPNRGVTLKKLFSLHSKEIDQASKIHKEIIWWKVSAVSLPIIGLAFLFFLQLFGFESLYEKSLTIGFTIFAFTGFLWWWWVMHTVGSVNQTMQKVTKDFADVQKHIVDIKKDIKK